MTHSGVLTFLAANVFLPPQAAKAGLGAAAPESRPRACVGPALAAVAGSGRQPGVSWGVRGGLRAPSRGARWARH